MFVLIKTAYCNINTTINTEKARGLKNSVRGPHVPMGVEGAAGPWQGAKGTWPLWL